MKAQKVFKCTECDVEEPTLLNLRRHLQRVHWAGYSAKVKVRKIFTCTDACGFSRWSEAPLMRHLAREHSLPADTKPHLTAQCNHCPYFVTGAKIERQRHTNAHQHASMPCPYAGCKRKPRSGFKDGLALAVHLLGVHEDEEAALLAREAVYHEPWGQDMAFRSRFDAVVQSAAEAGAPSGAGGSATGEATDATMSDGHQDCDADVN